MRLKIAWPLSGGGAWNWTGVLPRPGARGRQHRRRRHPVVCGDRGASPAGRWRGAGGHGGRRQRPGTQAMAAQTVQHFGRIDILVNNAAIYGG